MSRSEEVRLNLRRSGRESEGGKRFERTATFYYEVAGIIAEVLAKGGAVSTYTSKDGAATAVAIKSGKDRWAYWFGPDDNIYEVLEKMRAEWGLSGLDDPLYDEVHRLAGQMMEEGRDAP